VNRSGGAVKTIVLISNINLMAVDVKLKELEMRLGEERTGKENFM
jgi:hypothetical protein